MGILSGRRAMAIAERKTFVIAVILIIISGGAFVYFDPLDLDLLGLKPAVVAKPATPPRTAALGAQPAKAPIVPAPVAPIPAAQAPANIPVAAPNAPASTPAAQSLAPAPKAPVASAPPAPVVTPSVVVPTQTMQPPLKLAKTMKAAKGTQSGKSVRKSSDSFKPERPRDQDLRHCLGLESNAAIAKCAGE